MNLPQLLNHLKTKVPLFDNRFSTSVSMNGYTIDAQGNGSASIPSLNVNSITIQLPNTTLKHSVVSLELIETWVDDGLLTGVLNGRKVRAKVLKVKINEGVIKHDYTLNDSTKYKVPLEGFSSNLSSLNKEHILVGLDVDLEDSKTVLHLVDNADEPISGYSSVEAFIDSTPYLNAKVVDNFKRNVFSDTPYVRLTKSGNVFTFKVTNPLGIDFTESAVYTIYTSHNIGLLSSVNERFDQLGKSVSGGKTTPMMYLVPLGGRTINSVETSVDYLSYMDTNSRDIDVRLANRVSVLVVLPVDEQNKKEIAIIEANNKFKYMLCSILQGYAPSIPEQDGQVLNGFCLESHGSIFQNGSIYVHEYTFKMVELLRAGLGNPLLRTGNDGDRALRVYEASYNVLEEGVFTDIVLETPQGGRE